MSQIQLELNLNNQSHPPYQIRKSKRAKRIFLRIMPGKGLEVVIPERLRQYSIENLLNEHKMWIERMLEKYAIDPVKNAFTESDAQKTSLPSEFCFEAIQKKVQIIYEKIQKPRLSCRVIQNKDFLASSKQGEDIYQNETWVIQGEIENVLNCQKLINKMLKKEAARYLIPWLQNVSSHCKLPFESTKIRLQSSLWGSCTRAHKISLNAKLLFVEPRLVQYVLIHELCHTKHLNHSQRFWNLVYKFDPDFRLHKKLLRDAGKRIM